MTSQVTVAKYLSACRDTVSCARSLIVVKPERDYVPLDSHWRCGSGTMLPHSTQRTLPARCSSSETESEIRRLCVQAWGGFFGRGVGACPGPSIFTMLLYE